MYADVIFSAELRQALKADLPDSQLANRAVGSRIFCWTTAVIHVVECVAWVAEREDVLTINFMGYLRPTVMYSGGPDRNPTGYA